MSVVADLAAYSTVAVQFIWVIGLAAFIVNRTPIGMNNLLEGPKKALISSYREVSFIIALVATSGSLYFSEVMMLEPCPLCWYQRIFMYPLLVLFLSSILMMRKDVQHYAVPMAIIGAGISAYHYAVQILVELGSGCSSGASCEAAHFMYFDYVTIPLMALTAFITILVINLKFTDEEKENQENGFEQLYSS